MTRMGREVRGWLVDALRPAERRSSTWSSGGAPPPDLGGAAVAHGVEGWVREAGAAVGITVPGIDAAVHRVAARQQQVGANLREAAAALGSADVDFIVVKGPAVARTCHTNPLHRAYVDLDLLVRPRQLPAALESLGRGGFTLVDANWPLLSREGVQELRLTGPAGGAVDLHWSLGYARPERDQSPPVAELLARGRAIDLQGTRVLTLDRLDTLVHLALHAAQSGGNRLLWFADIRGGLAALTKPEVELLPARARRWHAGPATQLMLTRASRTLDIELPAGLVVEVGGRSLWRVVVGGVDGVWPPEAVVDTGSVGRLLARATSASPRLSMARAVGKSLSWMRTREGGPLTPDSGLFDPTNVDSPLRPDGGDQGVAEFVDAVVEQARARGR